MKDEYMSMNMVKTELLKPDNTPPGRKFIAFWPCGALVVEQSVFKDQI